MAAPSILRSLSGASAELVLSSLLISLLSLALPIAMLHVYDRVLAQNGVATFWALASAVVVALVLETALRILRGRVVARVGGAWEANTQARAMGVLSRTPIERFERSGAGLYLERLASIATVRDAYSGAAFQALLDLPFCLVYVAAMAHLSPTLAAVPVLLAALYLAVSLLVGRSLRRTVAALAEGEERRFNMLFDVLAHVHTVKALGLEQQMLRRNERLILRCAAARRKLAALSGHGHGAALLLASIGSALVAALGAVEVIEERITVGALGACLLLCGRSLQPLSSALTVFTRAEVLRGAAQRLAEITALPVPPPLPALAARHGEIRIERAVVRRDDGSPVLSGLDLHAPAGAIIGITARNGAGKTALLRLIAGLVTPSHGRVLIDGSDLSDVDPDSIAEVCALLPTQGALVRGTLLENLTMHRPSLAGRARAIAADLGLDAIAATLPQGYDTPLGEGGALLPRGAVQLVAIARALAVAPRIVLFDEANVFLDPAADRAVHLLLGRLRGHCTIVLVSARPSTLALAERRYTLADGRLGEVP
ncbi:ABC transporter transmembrane domain-containing protein [Elioraea rosea]|uniref:ABC transporter transmembrane domain-containing protein n=1 Tax=Elioraea rosea TaxID=2492390 RepID=UPI001182AFCE|nr:ABC transporter transmembrane domain-containing protein [Elioraea rosea]